MAHLPSPAYHGDQQDCDLPDGDDIEVSEVDALREENAELRTLVIQLSKLVIRNVVERERSS
jgi:hypothetical protein